MSEDPQNDREKFLTKDNQLTHEVESMNLSDLLTFKGIILTGVNDAPNKEVHYKSSFGIEDASLLLSRTLGRENDLRSQSY